MLYVYVIWSFCHSLGANTQHVTTRKIVTRFEVNVPQFEERQDGDFKFLEKS